MTTRTRYFVVASLLVLIVGVGTGLVAYYTGIPGLFGGQATLGELQLLPANANLVAYANVHDIMTSEVHQKVRELIPVAGQGQHEIAEQTGINIETDIDEIVACLAPPNADPRLPAAGLVLARGRFDQAKIEGLLRSHGATPESYEGVQLFVADHDMLSVAFLEPGLVALGSTPLIRAAVNQRKGGSNITDNKELMNLLNSLDRGDAWAIGRFDALASQTPLPRELASQLPPITWVAAEAQVNGAIRGTIRADVRDEQAAQDLREIVRGFVALAKLQTRSRPELKGFTDSLVIGGSGSAVSLAFNAPTELLNLIGQVHQQGFPEKPPQIPGK